MLETLESVQDRADREARQAREFVIANPAANAAEIAESVDEPAVLLEQIIRAVSENGNSISRYNAVAALVFDTVRTYANEQAELAYHHVIHTPG